MKPKLSLIRPAPIMDADDMAYIARLRKQPVGRRDADEFELSLLLCLDAAKRRRCPAAGYRFLMMHMTLARALGALLRIKPLEQDAIAAGLALNRACARPTEFLDLTTAEYQDLRQGLRTYFRVLPDVELGIFQSASILAREALDFTVAAA